MKVALLVLLGSAPQDLDSYFAFHRSAGIDVVVVGDASVPASAADIVDRHMRDGYVNRVVASSYTELARVAVDDLEADWVIPSTDDEVWWPRGESIRDVLSVIPPRYRVVQALTRTFVDGTEPVTGSPFASRIIRTSLHGSEGADGAGPSQLLRPVYRSAPTMTLDEHDWTLGGRRVPLRAWYPIEVFRFPSQSRPLGSEELDAGLADGSLAVDTRLRDALAAGDSSEFVVPTIVDDASYAVECAAVGEVDLARLDDQITQLERRIVELEARFWPTVRRALKRLARRSG